MKDFEKYMIRLGVFFIWPIIIVVVPVVLCVLWPFIPFVGVKINGKHY